MEILTVRGYTIPDDHNMTLDEFKEYYNTVNDSESYVENPEEARKRLKNIVLYKWSQDKIVKEISIFWKEHLGTTEIKNVYTDMRDLKSKHAIAIYNSKETPYATTIIRSLKIQGYIIETFAESELQFNLIKHELVPRHIICSTSKRNEILEKYNVTKDQLPQIRTSDPVARFYGMTKGQLIKIVRPAESMPQVHGKKLVDISYRIVV